MQNPLANFIGVFSLVRDDRGFQVNPLCRHDITRSDRQIGNQKYILWVKIIDFSFMPKIIRTLSINHVPLRYFVNYLP